MRILQYTPLFLVVFIPLGLCGFEKIDVNLLKKMGDAPPGTIFRVLVTFELYDISNLEKQLEDVVGHLRSYKIAQTLRTEANHAQSTLIQALQNKVPKPLRIETIWIVNVLLVEATKEIILKFGLDRLPENKNILEVFEDGTTPRERFARDDTISTRIPPPPDWGVEEINALPWIQAGYDGTNVIIGVIDSGAEATHPHLFPSWLGRPYGWWEPLLGSYDPYDVDMHGTQMLGIITGYMTGVARGSKWIMCSDHAPPMFNLTSYDTNSLTLLCGQYLICPDFDPFNRCSRRPMVINNAWGFPFHAPSLVRFDYLVSIWILGGQMPVFAAGNDGKENAREGRDGCETVKYPGDRVDVIQVGAVRQLTATNGTNRLQLVPESSKGPPSRRYPTLDYVANNLYKPDIVAPGGEIRTTTMNNGSPELIAISGTSPATAFATGAIALLLSRNSNLNYREVQNILYSGARRRNLRSENPRIHCGNIPDDVWPNFKFGFGSLKLPDPSSLGLGRPRPPSPIPR